MCQRLLKVPDDSRGEGGCSSSVKYLCDGKEDRLSVAYLESRLVTVQKIVLMEESKELVMDCTLKCFGVKW